MNTYQHVDALALLFRNKIMFSWHRIVGRLETAQCHGRLVRASRRSVHVVHVA
jgi:hypothetical protein